MSSFFTSKGVILSKNSPSFFSSIGFIKVTKVPYSEEEVSSAESFRKIAFSRKKASFFESTKTAINLSLTMLGTMCLWNGIIVMKTKMLKKNYVVMIVILVWMVSGVEKSIKSPQRCYLCVVSDALFTLCSIRHCLLFVINLLSDREEWGVNVYDGESPRRLTFT